MNDALPDDPDLWPADNFDVLGVPRGASDADIKKAYTRLIRRFKPEHHPDAFRRVREAYDQCREQAAWFRTTDDDEPSTVTYSPIHRRPDPEPQPAARPVADTGPSFHTAVDPLESLWDLAAEGREADAYAGLVDLVRVNRDRTEVPLRLYWLLALNPDLDGWNRTRHDWLAAALKVSRLTGPAAELYRRELEADPAAALGPAYGDILAVDAGADSLLALLRNRMAAAGRLQDTYRIEADLRAVKSRLTMDSEPGWLVLLLAAKEWTLGLTEATAADFLPPLFGELRHLELSQGWAFDRVESLDLLTRVMHRLHYAVPADLFALVRAAAFDPSGVSAAEAEAAAVAVGIGAVKELLRKYEGLFRDGESAVLELAVAAFTTCARRQNWSVEDGLSPDAIRTVVRRLPDLDAPKGYAPMRPAIIRILLDNSIEPNDLAEACEEDPDIRVRHVGKWAGEDTVLRFVWLVSLFKQQAAARRAKVVGG